MKMMLMTLLTLLMMTVPSSAQNALIFSAVENEIVAKVSMEVIHEAYQRLGISIRFKPYPAERAIVMASGTVISPDNLPSTL